MKQIILISTLAIMPLISCNYSQKKADKKCMEILSTGDLAFKSGYSDVNGLKMYYEIYGEGKPLVLIHGGGSTIQTTFGSVIPILAEHRQLIAVELQAHGRTNDRSTVVIKSDVITRIIVHKNKLPNASFPRQRGPACNLHHYQLILHFELPAQASAPELLAQLEAINLLT